MRWAERVACDEGMRNACQDCSESVNLRNHVKDLGTHIYCALREFGARF
jgi:hypothetical protein